ncbi:NAD-dependent epimerase/dehydratase family protein [Arthrobacter antioxidans]|uniref:NAD-dependent epimerase/dehydratase family protein n=1 Tax=Arthrobacter antioxidans TaxID=2895818 RepID=UPI001FFE6CCD|nr:NAD-dependent epimerase/dehydratase family protein [Arthrobacter antioxidans]
MKTVHAVVGAGALGTAVVRALAARGRETRLVSRRGSQPAPGVEVRTADATDTDGLARALDGSAVVYQCAQPAYSRWHDEFAALQQSVIDATVRVRADLVVADNLYMYGAPRHGALTEDSVEVPSSRKGHLRQAMATTAMDAHRHGLLRVALSRPSHYFGAGYDRNGKSVFATAAQGRPMQFLGRADALHSFSFVPDVAEAMVSLGVSGTGWGRAWIPPVQAALTQGDFAQRIWELAGQQGAARTRFLRPPQARVLGLVSPIMREVSEMMYEFEHPYVVDSTSFEQAFSLGPTPLDDAIEQTIAWYRS